MVNYYVYVIDNFSPFDINAGIRPDCDIFGGHSNLPLL